MHPLQFISSLFFGRKSLFISKGKANIKEKLACLCGSVYLTVSRGAVGVVGNVTKPGA